MNLIRASIERPIAVTAAVIMVIMFGALAMTGIPVQLAPDVIRPIITIKTFWRGAAPAEIEREIINRQEEVLAGLESLEEMVSSAQSDQAEVTLEFRVGTNMDRALLLVANRLDRVGNYPDEVDEPILGTAGTNDAAIAWFILERAEGNNRPIYEFGDFAQDIIKERLERVEGVGGITVLGGGAKELQIIVNAEKMARYGISISSMVNSLRAANIAASAGSIDEGKRSYVVRTEGELNDPAQVGAVLLKSFREPNSGQQLRVTVSDVAELQFGYSEPNSRIRFLGSPAIAINAVRETGANVIHTLEGIAEAVEELQPAAEAAGMKFRQVYSEKVYISSAIDLVQQNIWVGGSLAAIILMLFLRSFGATSIVSLAIPVCVVGSFVAMAALGRSLNVISLAGLAFAVGMVVDAAIVVLENIYRLRQTGIPVKEAAYRGASEVWPAVFVSALTTVAVFLPILVMELEVGQLFRDIAVAISVAVVLSLIVSITLIPALAQRFLRGDYTDKHSRRPLPVIDPFASGFSNAIVTWTAKVTASPPLSAAFVVIMCIGAGIVTWTMLPKLEYLPEGNRNFILGIALPPPGYNLDTTTGITADVEDAIRHLWANNADPEATSDEAPKIQRYFAVSLQEQVFMGAVAEDPNRVRELIPILRAPMFKEPGTFGFTTQPSIFGRGAGGSRAINVDISGPDLEKVLGIALQATGKLTQLMPREQGHQFRPIPGLELGSPEVRVLPNRRQLADAGVSARELSMTVDAYNDGLRVAEITVAGERVNLMLMGADKAITETQKINSLPVLTADGTITTVDTLADVVPTSGPMEIRHLERVRTVTLQVRPAPGLALEQALEKIKTEVIQPLEAAGLPPGLKIGLSGTADKLTTTWEAMKVQLLVALAVVYLVMVVLFESFTLPLVIIISVPMATAGAVIGLGLLNLRPDTFQPLDMLTLMGFVILIGIVVNNAILLVYQTLHHQRSEGMDVRDAILEATRNRIRPIFMSTLTSVFGMLPLVLFPGAGSELYRGLGSVVVGGLALSAVLTLAIVPPLLSLVLRGNDALAQQENPTASATST